MSKPKSKAREFYLKQFSPDGGQYSDIRVLRPSQHYDPVPSGHDDLNIDQVIHVIEYSAYAKLQAEVERLRNIIEEKASDNDEFGAEYTIVQMQKAKLQRQDEMLDAFYDNTNKILGKNQGCYCSKGYVCGTHILMTKLKEMKGEK